MLLAVVTMPLLYLGSWLGYRLNAVIPPRLFALVLIGIAITGSLKLLAGYTSMRSAPTTTGPA